MGRGNRRGLLFGSAVVAIVLALASTAWACTTFKGRMTVTDANGNSSTVVGDGSGMDFCDTGFGDKVPAADTGATGTPGAQITVSVEPADCNGTTFQLDDGNYDVNFVNWVTEQNQTKSGFKSTDGGATYDWWADCMSGILGAQVVLADQTFQVVNGTNTGTPYTLPGANEIDWKVNDLTTDQSAVCVSSNGGGQGLQAPILINQI
jgi:hypothetical protein